MGLFRGRKTTPATGFSLDEYVGDGGRDASPLELSSGPGWQERLASITKQPSGRADLALSAFSLIRGGDMFERKSKPARTSDDLISTYVDERLELVANGAAKEEREAARAGVLRVLSGNPAICRRMLLAKPIDLVILPKDDDFRRYGFPKNTNPNAAGLFWNSGKRDKALIGLREELIVEKPYLMIHEMTHAVHLMGQTKREREDIDKFLMPVYRSKTWVEEAVAIYAERAFGAEYTDDDLRAPGLYGKTRRDWNDRQVFSLFIAELLRPK